MVTLQLSTGTHHLTSIDCTQYFQSPVFLMTDLLLFLLSWMIVEIGGLLVSSFTKCSTPVPLSRASIDMQPSRTFFATRSPFLSLQQRRQSVKAWSKNCCARMSINDWEARAVRARSSSTNGLPVSTGDFYDIRSLPLFHLLRTSVSWSRIHLVYSR